jgi:hypothetical protein
MTTALAQEQGLLGFGDSCRLYPYLTYFTSPGFDLHHLCEPIYLIAEERDSVKVKQLLSADSCRHSLQFKFYTHHKGAARLTYIGFVLLSNYTC